MYYVQIDFCGFRRMIWLLTVIKLVGFFTFIAKITYNVRGGKLNILQLTD